MVKSMQGSLIALLQVDWEKQIQEIGDRKISEGAI
jgi:hypothetical protein